MGSLKDELLRAGLIDEKKARQSEHQQRVKRKKQGRETLQREQAVAREEAREQAERQRVEDRKRAEFRQAREAERERELREAQRRRSTIDAAYEEGEIRGWEGNRRYYYTHGKRVEFLLVSDETSRKLEQGNAAICQARNNATMPTLLTSAAAKRLSEAAPERVLAFHGEATRPASA